MTSKVTYSMSALIDAGGEVLEYAYAAAAFGMAGLLDQVKVDCASGWTDQFVAGFEEIAEAVRAEIPHYNPLEERYAVREVAFDLNHVVYAYNRITADHQPQARRRLLQVMIDAAKTNDDLDSVEPDPDEEDPEEIEDQQATYTEHLRYLWGLRYAIESVYAVYDEGRDWPALPDMLADLPALI